MPKHNVFTNSCSNIHKGSGDKAIAGAPNVCKTPIGSAVVPIPYPNVSESATLKKGSKTVKINGQPVALEGSIFEYSSGDEAGSLGGVLSGVTSKETRFISGSFDVRIEEKNVIRHMDATTHNHGNTLGTVYGSSTEPVKPIEEEKCPYCKKTRHDFVNTFGSNVGDGQELRKNIIKNIEDHRWYTQSNALQAHHLICSESMNDTKWSTYCEDFGYNINHQKNGVMLPYFMELACQLHVPIHRSNHSAGRAEGATYPKKIKRNLRKMAADIKTGVYCDNPKALIDKLNRYSLRVLKKIDSFHWTITADGTDYKMGNKGCASVTSITNKPNKPCDCDRMHGLTRQNETVVISKNSQPLEIGK